MNIYLLTQSERKDYDTYDSCVVVAKNEKSAQNTMPSEHYDWGDCNRVWASKPENVTVTLIGVAAPKLKAGVVCASFNAG